MNYRDVLKDWPGLTPQPRPETPEFEQLIEELAFSTAEAVDEDHLARLFLRFMLRRGYWPLGTRCVVFPSGHVNVTFPKPPERQERAA